MHILVTTGLICLLMTLNNAQEELDCKCNARKKHLQSHFCDADFAVKATILEKTETPEVIIYKINVLEVFKVRWRRTLEPGETFLTTPANPKCTSFFPNGATHVIIGKMGFNSELSTDSCVWSPTWIELSESQEKGVTGEYLKNCDACKVVNCRKEKTIGNCGTPWCCKQTKQYNRLDTCVLLYDFPITSHDACYRRHSICKRNTESMYCEFERNDALDACIANDNLTRNIDNDVGEETDSKDKSKKSRSKGKQRDRTKKRRKPQ